MNRTSPSAPPTANEVLGVDGLSVALGGRTILDHVTFSVAQGSFTALIGSNGAGKTTLLKVMLGLIPPTAGRVRLAGATGDHRRRLIGYVPQKIALEPDIALRARDLVGLGIDGERFGISLPSKARRGAVDEMLAAVGATSFADARVGNLSGGEQQRVLIAHALISRPALLLLDEPLANLDIASSQEVVELLASITAKQRIAVLISAHDMNPMLSVMDRIVYLADGRAATGTTDEVVRTETLTALYRHPVEVIHTNGRVLVVAGPGADAVVMGAESVLVGGDSCRGPC